MGALQTRKFVLCSIHNKIPPIPWPMRFTSVWAEQDNRVRLPNGTAAVSSLVSLLGESQSLEQSGKAKRYVGGYSLKGASQKTYGTW